MNVLSLFDGMSCGQIALNKLGIKVDKYFASEIKKHAIKVTKHNYPDTIHIGDVNKVSYKDGTLYTENGNYEVGVIDLLIGGSPCQDLSSAQKNRTGLNGEKSSLFWQYARVKKEVNPKYFMLENVGSMPYSDAMEITKELGVDGVRINSSLVSAQLRNRIYWTNIDGDGVDLFGNSYIEQPIDKGIKLSDILEYGCTDREKSRALLARAYIAAPNGNTKNRYLFRRYNQGFLNAKWSNTNMIQDNILMLSRRELERLQTVPDGYTDCVSFMDASNLLGDGWTIDVICHIFKNLKL